jgi:hypothetical protein
VTPAKSATSATPRERNQPYSDLAMTHTMPHMTSKERAQNGARREAVPHLYGGARRTLCAWATIRFLMLSAVIAWTLPLHATEQVEVRWSEVCRVADGHQLTITTTNGDTVDGYCMSINVDEMAVTTKDRRVVKVARAALSRIQMQMQPSPKGHYLRSLGKGMHEGFRQGFSWLLSPYAPLGLVVVPGTVAWGAIAAPFCLLGDLKDNTISEQSKEIKVI